VFVWDLYVEHDCIKDDGGLIMDVVVCLCECEHLLVQESQIVMVWVCTDK
jgi:hypothetical protein